MGEAAVRGAPRPAAEAGADRRPDAASAARLNDAAFRRAILRWTAAYWTVIYVLFTLRSLVEPRPYVLTQAGLRLIMMAVGVALSLALLRIVRRIDLREWPRRAALLAGLALAADVVYLVVNYFVFYVVPGLWEPEHGAIAKIGSYIVEFFWVFPGWILLYLLVARRHAAAESEARTPQLDSLWIGSRGSQRRVPLDSIDWIEAEGDYVRIHAGERSHLLRSTMSRMERTLDPARFVRVHRGVIVAAPLIEAVTRDSDGRTMVVLAGGRRLPVGRSYLRRLNGLIRSGPAPASAPEG